MCMDSAINSIYKLAMHSKSLSAGPLTLYAWVWSLTEKLDNTTYTLYKPKKTILYILKLRKKSKFQYLMKT